jgi:Mrp family chromosome partitioning ATPase
MRARLSSGRPFSAVLIDGHLGGLDRDVVATATAHDCPVIVVDDRGPETWRDLGAATVLAPPFAREELLEALAAHTRMVGAAVHQRSAPTPTAPTRQGEVVTVLGPGGAGASTAAIALAQGLASGDRAVDGPVLLADLCRAADQAMLHDSRVVVPGLQELVEAHRSGQVPPAVLREQTFEVADRGYRLLLGLRRPRHWVAIRPRAFDVTLESLERSFAVTVCDVDADLEGEAETGSTDVEERHLLARGAVARSSLVFVVGAPGVKGLFSLVRSIGEVLAFGTPVERLVPVITRGPRGPRQRAELTTALRSLLAANVGDNANTLINPVHLPERRVDEALRDGVPLPKPLPATLAATYHAVRERVGPLGGRSVVEPRRVTPGTMPSFTATEPSRRD